VVVRRVVGAEVEARRRARWARARENIVAGLLWVREWCDVLCMLGRAVNLTVETTDSQRRSWMTSGAAGGDCHFRTHLMHLDIYNTFTKSKQNYKAAEPY
jgi:hypothetical protein